MDLSLKLRNYLIKNGATNVGYADITHFTPKPGLNTGIVFYVECDDGLRTIESDRIIRSAYTIEELLAD